VRVALRDQTGQRRHGDKIAAFFLIGLEPAGAGSESVLAHHTRRNGGGPPTLILVVVFDATSYVALWAMLNPPPALTMEDQTPLAEASMEPTFTACEQAVTKYVEDGSPNSPNAAELHSIQQALCRTPEDNETLSELTGESR
jgi:hypothetical protein